MCGVREARSCVYGTVEGGTVPDIPQKNFEFLWQISAMNEALYQSLPGLRLRIEYTDLNTSKPVLLGGLMGGTAQPGMK